MSRDHGANGGITLLFLSPRLVAAVAGSFVASMKDLPLSLALVVLLSACQENGTDWRTIAFKSSAIFQRIVAGGYTPAFMEESTTDAYVEVATGVSMPERFDRWATLRLYRDGHVGRSMLDASGAEIWVRDIQTAESGSAAYASQPIRSQTNSPSPAAGSRR